MPRGLSAMTLTGAYCWFPTPVVGWLNGRLSREQLLIHLMRGRNPSMRRWRGWTRTGAFSRSVRSPLFSVKDADTLRH